MFMGIGMSLWIVWGLEWDVHVYRYWNESMDCMGFGIGYLCLWVLE